MNIGQSTLGRIATHEQDKLGVAMIHRCAAAPTSQDLEHTHEQRAHTVKRRHDAEQQTQKSITVHTHVSTSRCNSDKTGQKQQPAREITVRKSVRIPKKRHRRGVKERTGSERRDRSAPSTARQQGSPDRNKKEVCTVLPQASPEQTSLADDRFSRGGVLRAAGRRATRRRTPRSRP